MCTCRNLSAWKTTNEKSNFLSLLRCCSSRCCLRAIIARDDRNKRKLKFSCPAQYTPPNPLYPSFLLVSAFPQPFSCFPLCCAVPRRVRFNFVAVSPCRIFWLGLYGPPLLSPAPCCSVVSSPCSASLLWLTFCAVCALLSTFCHFICSVKYFGPLPNVFPLLLLPSPSVLFLYCCLLSCVVADAFATFAFAIRICRCSWGQLVIKRENISLIIVGQLLECAPKAKETKRGTKQPKKTVKVAQRDSPANGDTFILLFSLLLFLLLFSSSAFEHRCFSFWRSSFRLLVCCFCYSCCLFARFRLQFVEIKIFLPCSRTVPLRLH